MFKRIKEIAINYGANLSEIINVCDIDINYYSKIILEYPENLNYLKKIDIRKNIKNFFPQAKSVLICLYQYWNSKIDYQDIISNIEDLNSYIKKTNRKVYPFLEKKILKGNKISRYALSYDYHKTIREILNETLLAIKKEFKDVEGKIFVDTSPVIEKELVKMSGLGWQGKNTLIINKKLGSYFFIGGIALNIDVDNNINNLNENLCKNCNRCILSCPTKALSEYKLNPLKCISYWTTHNKTDYIPDFIIQNNDGWIYGCDKCQEVCPYNLNVNEKVNERLLPINCKM